MSEPHTTPAFEKLHRRMALATALLLLPPFVLSLTWVGEGFQALYSPKTRMGIEFIGPWFIGGVLALALLGSALILISCARAPRTGGPASSRLRLAGLWASGLGLCAIAISCAGLATAILLPPLGLKSIGVFYNFGPSGLAIALLGAFTIGR